MRKGKHKIAAAAAVVVATLATLIFLTRPTGTKFFYDNDLGSYFGIPAAEDALLAWHSRNGDNGIFMYGVDGKISSTGNWTKIATYIKKAKRKGLTTVGFIYSTPNQLANLDAYQKAQPNDSTKFTAVVSEIEPYRTGDYAGFYKSLRAYSDWAKKQSPRVERVCYMGWPTAECWDSIVNLTDRIFMHAYLKSSIMSGPACYSYMKTRLNTVATITEKYHTADPNFKTNVVMINSDEAVFSGDYFRANSFDKPVGELISYLSTSGDAIVKKRITIGGRIIFQSKDGRIVKP